MAFKLAQLSDTHLGANTPLFRANFDRVASTLATHHPDLVIHTGDVSLDGAGSESDMAFAGEQLRRLGIVHSVPGNHDVGDHRERAPKQPVDTERLNRFRRHIGRDRWVIDHDGWRLLGLNSQIMGAHIEEHAQAAMIEDALDTLDGRLLAVFIHKPIFVTHPADPTFDYWSVPPFARAPLLPVLAHPALRLVASGHLHLRHTATRGVARLEWAPSVAFIVAEADQPDLPGTRPTGLLLHRFGAGTVDTTLIEPDGMQRPLINELGIYG